MKKETSTVYRTPVLYFRRAGFKNFLANIGIDSRCVYPSLELDPLDFDNEITLNGNFTYPFVLYDIDLSTYTEDSRIKFRGMLNKHQPDFF